MLESNHPKSTMLVGRLAVHCNTYNNASRWWRPRARGARKLFIMITLSLLLSLFIRLVLLNTTNTIIIIINCITILIIMAVIINIIVIIIDYTTILYYHTATNHNHTNTTYHYSYY